MSVGKVGLFLLVRVYVRFFVRVRLSLVVLAGCVLGEAFDKDIDQEVRPVNVHDLQNGTTTISLVFAIRRKQQNAFTVPLTQPKHHGGSNNYPICRDKRRHTPSRPRGHRRLFQTCKPCKKLSDTVCGTHVHEIAKHQHACIPCCTNQLDRELVQSVVDPTDQRRHEHYLRHGKAQLRKINTKDTARDYRNQPHVPQQQSGS